MSGRDDLGRVISEGVNVGTLYCVAVHFPSTGEVVYYEKAMVETVDQDGSD